MQSAILLEQLTIKVVDAVCGRARLFWQCSGWTLVISWYEHGLLSETGNSRFILTVLGWWCVPPKAIASTLCENNLNDTILCIRYFASYQASLGLHRSAKLHEK